MYVVHLYLEYADMRSKADNADMRKSTNIADVQSWSSMDKMQTLRIVHVQRTQTSAVFRELPTDRLSSVTFPVLWETDPKSDCVICPKCVPVEFLELN